MKSLPLFTWEIEINIYNNSKSKIIKKIKII